VSAWEVIADEAAEPEIYAEAEDGCFEKKT
jgi:hypothetical protein